MKAEYWKVHKNSIKFLKNINTHFLKTMLDKCLEFNSDYIYIMINVDPNNKICPMYTPISFMPPTTNIINWCEVNGHEYKGEFDLLKERRQKLQKLLKIYDK